jgi:MYXO-CTERM domain-containing protein
MWHALGAPKSSVLLASRLACPLQVRWGMSFLRFVIVPVLGALTYVAFAPSVASACSQPLCSGGKAIPFDGAVVPANIERLLWNPQTTTPFFDDEVPMELRVVDVSDGSEVPFELDSEPRGELVMLGTALEPNRTYRLEATSGCQEGKLLSTEFYTTRAAPLPQTLGLLRNALPSIGALQVAHGGSCTTSAQAAQVELFLNVSEDARPWQDALVYTTYVDGQPWSPSKALNENRTPGEGWQGRGRDVVYALCDAEQGTITGTTEGVHEAWIEARVVGSSGVALRSNSVHFTLACSPPVEQEWAPHDWEGEGGHSHCSVGTPGGSGIGTTLWWLAGAFALLWLRRRREQR